MKKLEILAPAGGPDTILPAVRNGADAVYLGASLFSARASAKNFSREELARAVDYCHENGVDVHLAVNILVRDEEIPAAMDLIEYACRIGVDALIMQDLGLITLTRSLAPEMPIHGSTQLSVHTLDGVKHLASLGLTRAVLSRELSREEIRKIAEGSPIELEVFVHGALCMSVSGQCYFSSILGTRSGNRGACAQPCRLPFAPKGKEGCFLSLKDLSIIPYLRELQDMGIASAKIEGRMKRPEYVAAAVKACRESLDSGTVSAETQRILRSVFARSGFTDGYYTGRRGADMFGVRSKEDVTASDHALFGAIHETYKIERSHLPVDMTLTVSSGMPAALTADDREGHRAHVAGEVPQAAVNVPLSRERCEKSLRKTGGTPYLPGELHMELEEGLSLPASALNQMRASALQELSRQRRVPRSKPCLSYEPLPLSPAPGPAVRALRARFVNCRVPDDFLDCELITVPLHSSEAELEELLRRGFALCAEIPRGMFGTEKLIRQQLRRVKAVGIYDVLASNVGAVECALEEGMDVHGGFGLNLTNTRSLQWASDAGLMDAEVSFELTLEEIRSLGGTLPLGLISYGRLPMMLTRNCPAAAAFGGCRHCQEAPVCVDRRQKEFPVQCLGGCTEVLNSLPLSLAGDRIERVSFEMLRFTIESPEESAAIFRAHRNGRKPDGPCTRGLYRRREK